MIMVQRKEPGTEKSFHCKSVCWGLEPSLFHKKLTTPRKPVQFLDSYSSIKLCFLCLFHCFIYLIDEYKLSQLMVTPYGGEEEMGVLKSNQEMLSWHLLDRRHSFIGQ